MVASRVTPYFLDSRIDRDMLQLQSYTQVLSTFRKRSGARRAGSQAGTRGESGGEIAAVADRPAAVASSTDTATGPSATETTVRVELIDAVPSLGTGPDRAIRVANVIFAALLLIAFAPVMLLVALAVRLTSEGPVIYR